MRFQTLGGGIKPEKVWITIKNGEASAALTPGDPVVWKNTGDCINVTKLSTGAALLGTSCLVGVCCGYINAGKIGIAQVYGLNNCAKLFVRTKTDAAGTDVSFAASTLSAGVLLHPDTAHNMFSTVASVAASAFVPWGVNLIATTLTSQGGVASTLTSDTIVAPAVFLRLM